jgi:hypothetical protein
LRAPRSGRQIGRHHPSTDREDQRARPAALPDGLQARPATGDDLEDVVVLCRSRTPSPTSATSRRATRLYERAGMRVEDRFDFWVKRLG